MEYKYYVEEINTEHMLYATEIAQIFGANYAEFSGISDQKIHAIIRKYIADFNINEKKYFYKNKYGLSRVYPADVYIPAMRHFLDNK